MNGDKYTIVGTRYYNEEKLQELIEKDHRESRRRGHVCFLKRDPKFENAVQIYFMDNSTLNTAFRVGTLSTSKHLIFEGTKSGASLAEKLSFERIYETVAYFDDFEISESKEFFLNRIAIEVGSISMLDVHSLELVEKISQETNNISFPINFNGDSVRYVTLGVDTSQLETTNLTQPTNKKEKNMKTMNSMFSKFGKDFAYPTSNFAMSMFGGLAVKQGGSFVTYDAEKNEAMDVMDFVMDGFSEMIMIVPTQGLVKGDMFVQDGKVYQLLEDSKVYSFTDNSIDVLVSKSNIMGFKMYAKVFNLMANFGGAGQDGVQNMFANPMMMMMMMKDGSGDTSDMMQMMMMSQMFQGGGFKF